VGGGRGGVISISRRLYFLKSERGKKIFNFSFKVNLNLFTILMCINVVFNFEKHNLPNQTHVADT
jgi:hypothetical protein